MVAEMVGSDKLEEVEAFITQLKKVWKMLEDQNPNDVMKNAVQLNNN